MSGDVFGGGGIPYNALKALGEGGGGKVKKVASVDPDAEGNVPLGPSDIGAIPAAAKAAANGVASLDSTSKIPVAQLPPLAITDTFPVANQAAMLALTAERGDVASRLDNGRDYILLAEPASTLANWRELGTGKVMWRALQEREAQRAASPEPSH